MICPPTEHQPTWMWTSTCENTLFCMNICFDLFYIYIQYLLSSVEDLSTDSSYDAFK